MIENKSNQPEEDVEEGSSPWINFLYAAIFIGGSIYLYYMFDNLYCEREGFRKIIVLNCRDKAMPYLTTNNNNK